MDKLFLELTNQVGVGIENEKLSIERCCRNMAIADDEIITLEAKLSNLEQELPTLLIEHRKNAWRQFSNTAFLASICYGMVYFIYVYLEPFAINSDPILQFLLNPITMLILFNFNTIGLIIAGCDTWEHHRKIVAMDKTEQLKYFKKRINRRIDFNREKITANTIKANEHVENIKQLTS